MICDRCRLSVGRILTMGDYELICAVADDPIARWDGSIGTEGCAWFLPKDVDEWVTRMPSQELTEVEKEKGYVNIMPHLDMKSAQNTRIIGWSATQTDMLAFDWYVVDEEDE